MSVIGGMFGLMDATRDPQRPAFFGDDGSDLFLANARSGWLSLLLVRQPAAIWLPSYLCATMVACLTDELRSRVRYYPVDHELSVSDRDWCSGVGAGDAVCVIDYFGWPSSASLKEQLRSAGAFVVEDACQALLSAGLGEQADYLLFSPRKFLGVPDGGILRSLGDGGLQLELQPAPRDWWLSAHEAAALRRKFDDAGACGRDRRWYELFRLAEQGPCGPFSMSEMSQALLHAGFDYDEIGRRRRRNYHALHRRLNRIAFFPELAAGVVPLGFVARFSCMEQRELVRADLIAEEVYPPIHWRLADVVPPAFEASHTLAERLMTFPCDQRYGLEEMSRIAEIVERSLGVA